jgi:7-cyano-7-deazaguanine synthase in queuosine biosynthesis
MITVPDDVKNIGIKMSGGCDSSIVAYMLCNEIVEKNLDVKLIPITVDLKGKAFQIEFAKRVVDFLEKEFSIKFGKHYTVHCPKAEKYISFQNALITHLYDKKIIDCHFTGITKNPPDKSFTSWQSGPVDNRSGDALPNSKSFWPLKNIDKKGVCELYLKYNLLDTLFPITRSCEAWTDDFSYHCGECWWCKEREWGFGRL